MTCPSRYLAAGGEVDTCALKPGHAGDHVGQGPGCLINSWTDPRVQVDEGTELADAIAAVKRDLGVDVAHAGELAKRLPEHLRGPFWERAVDQHLAARLADLDEQDQP